MIDCTIAKRNVTLIGQIMCVLVIQDGVQDGRQRIFEFWKLHKLVDFSSILFHNTSFQLAVWPVSPLWPLADYVEQQYTLLALEFLFGDQ